MESLLLIIIKVVTRLISKLPIRVSVGVVANAIWLLSLFLPNKRKIALVNLKLAFPNKEDSWYLSILQRSYTSLARVLIDFARLDTLNTGWVLDHVDCPFLSGYRELKSANPDKGILIFTGHLGSFELLAHCMPMYGHPISFVVRNFDLKKIDAWWTAAREKYGNKVISRRGAFSDALKELNSGRDLAVLFDQNVRRNHAVFVDWFGTKAATTRMPAILALRTECKAIVASIHYEGNDKYRVDASECNLDDIYSDQSLDTEQKIFLITERASKLYQDMIKSHPEDWFWMHRRWRTRPEGETERIYSAPSIGKDGLSGCPVSSD